MQRVKQASSVIRYEHGDLTASRRRKARPQFIFRGSVLSKIMINEQRLVSGRLRNLSLFFLWCWIILWGCFYLQLTVRRVLGASLKKLEIVFTLPKDEAGKFDLIVLKKKPWDLTDFRQLDLNIPSLPSPTNALWRRCLWTFGFSLGCWCFHFN